MPSLDPTKTEVLRKRYAQAMNRRFRELSKHVREWFDDQPGRTLFDFPTSVEKARAFEVWLSQQIGESILQVSFRIPNRLGVGRHWQDSFIRAAYIKGVSAAESNLAKIGGLINPMIDIQMGVHAGVHAETLQLMYSRVFESLRGITESMSSQLSEIFTRSLIDGVGPRTIAKRITDQIASISRKRAMVMARTEVIRTYSEATLNTMEANHVDGVAAEVELLTAGDKRVCSVCRSLEGKVYTIQEARGRIPVHPRCLPGDTVITSAPRVSTVFKRWYNGNLVIINTSRGEQLSCTPNHPILTPHGFVAAKLIKAGCNIVCCHSGNGMSASGADYYDVPARIEDIAESFFRSSKVFTAEMPVSPEDFYGDGVGGDVYVASTDIELLSPLNTDVLTVIDPDSICNMLGMGSTDVFVDDVVSVDVREFHGYVYDLQTDGGFFVANHIAVSNCRCTWISVPVGKQQNAA